MLLDSQSVSGKRNLDSTFKARRAIHVGNVPSDLDKDIWSVYKSSDFAGKVLVACQSRELAYERTNRGAFTVALLKTLVDIGVDKLTYATLFDRMPPLSSR